MPESLTGFWAVVLVSIFVLAENYFHRPLVVRSLLLLGIYPNERSPHPNQFGLRSVVRYRRSGSERFPLRAERFPLSSLEWWTSICRVELQFDQ